MALTRTRPRRLLIVILSVVALLAACGQERSTTFSSVGATISAAPTASVAPSPVPASFPLTLTDDAGRSVTLPAAPARVVSLAPSNTEILCAIGACDTLTGVTDFDEYPAAVTSLPKVVINATVDAEKVVAARPDLVLAAGNGLTSEAAIRQLTDLGLQVLTLYPKDLNGIYTDIGLVGEATGRVDAAATLVSTMRARVAAVASAVAGAPRPRTFYEVSVYQGVIYTAGRGSFLASLIDAAGGDPVTGDALSTAIGLETLVNEDPQLILLGDASYDPSLADRDAALSTLRGRAGWEVMSAVREGRVIPFLDDVVTTRPGPRIVDGLEALARAIHPERFNQ